jgi:hypothetical protein
MPGGRLRKFATIEEGRRHNNRQQYLRRRLQQRRPEFLSYKPFLPQDIPNKTPPAIGLRISPTISIPHDVTGLPNNELQDKHETRQFSALLFIDNHDVGVSEQIKQVQEKEKEWNNEQVEYEAAIAH